MRKRHPIYLGIWTLGLLCGWTGYDVCSKHDLEHDDPSGVSRPVNR